MKIDHAQKVKTRFFITHHKAGSIFCYTLLKKMAPYVGLNAVDPALANWLSTKPQEEKDVLRTYKFESFGKVYMTRADPELSKNKSINFSEILGVAMVRDPRDTLVSSYCSAAYSHGKRVAESEETFHGKREQLQKMGCNAFLQTDRCGATAANYEFMFEFFHNNQIFYGLHMREW